MATYRLAFVLFTASPVLAAAQSGPGASTDEREETYRRLSVFARVLNYIQTNHVTGASPRALVYAAIQGLVSELDGRSEFFTPEQFQDLRREARRREFDLGFTLREEDSRWMVATVDPSHPAYRRGLRAGDRLLSVDGRLLGGQSFFGVEDALYAFRTEDKVLGLVGPDGRSHRVRLRLQELRRPTVHGFRRRAGPLVLRIDRFTEATVVEVLDALDRHRPIRRLVLDLRANQGGVVEAAARVADLWLDGGVIATTEARGEVLERFVAHRAGTEPAYPIACLVDAATASAAELVASALQEANRARILGRPTFGKGSVQTVIELEDGSGLRLTVSRYYSGRHRSLDGVGIEPDVLLPVPTSTTVDHDLEAAVRWLSRPRP